MLDILLSFELESLKLGLLTSQKYWEKPLVIFNTASKCGFTKQLKQFQELYETGKMIPIAIPTNDFGSQEPGDDYEIYQYCHYNYGVEFPVIKKTNIQHNFFQMFGKPSWNFNKYIFDKKHKFIGKFDSKILPIECLQYV
jgi:glutathione peroxidase